MGKREKLVKLANEEVQNNSLYMWSGQGELVLKTDPAELLKRETSNENVARILKTLAGKILQSLNMKKSKYFDCSGLVVYILQKLEVIKDDYTAAGIYDKLCIPITKSDLKAGDLVFCKSSGKIGHVGIYASESLVIEAAGRDIGVVKRGMSKNNWNIYGRLKDL